MKRKFGVAVAAMFSAAGLAQAQTPRGAPATAVPAIDPQTARAARRAPQADLAPLLPARLLANAEALRDAALAGRSPAWDILEGLTTEIGPRPAGSPAMRRAADWAVARMTALGFENVHKEPFTHDAWTRGAETAEVTAPFPQKLVIAALGGSVATPPQGIEAEVALFRSYDELLSAAPGSLNGRIAVVTQPMPRGGYGAYYRIRGLGPTEAAKRGAVAYLLRSLATDVRRSPHTGTMTYLPDFSGGAQRPAPRIPAAALSAPDAEQLERIAARGRPIRMRLVLTPTTTPGQVSETVVGEVRGRERPEEAVVIGGHLDSWDLGTGAFDDGGGVAITAAAAKLIRDMPQRPRRTIRVVWWGAEEVGQSNTAFAAAHPAAEQARMVIASECDSGPDGVTDVSLPAGAAASSFGRTLGRVIAPLGAFVSPQVATDGGADLENLRGVPLASLEPDRTRYFELHHTPDDTLDKIDRRLLDKAVAGWAAFAYLAADSEVDFRALAAAAPARSDRER